MRSAAVWRADMQDSPVNESVRADLFQPRHVAISQLAKPSSQHLVFGDAGKLRKQLRQFFKHFVGKFRLLRFFGILFRMPSLSDQALADLRTRIPILDLRELCTQILFKGITARFPLLLQQLTSRFIERYSRGRDFITNHGNVVL